MKLILHIGQGKAGSTAIQRTLAAGRDELLRKGVLYPENLYIKNCHHYFSTLNFDVPQRWPSVVNRMGFSIDSAKAGAKEEWENLQEQLTNNNPKITIISSETLFSDYSPTEAIRAKKYLGSLADEMRILAYLRSPVSRYISLVQQKLKSSRILVQPAASGVVKIISKYNEIFTVPCELRVFERNSLKSGDAVVDFVEWSGLQELGIDFPKAEFNTSMSAEAMAVLENLASDHGPTTAEALKEKRTLQSQVSRADKDLPGATRAHLNDEVSDYLTRINKELLPLRDKYGIEFSDIDYTMVGKIEGLNKPLVTSVNNICAFDFARRDELQALVVKRLARKKKRMLNKK